MVILFTCFLTTRSADHTIQRRNIELLMNLEEGGWKLPWPNLIHYPGVCVHRLSKITTIIRHDIRFPVGNLYRGLTESKPECPATRRERAANTAMNLQSIKAKTVLTIAFRGDRIQ